MWLAICLQIIGFLTLLAAFTPNIRGQETLAIGLILSGIGLCICSFLWVCFSVTCKKCRAPLIWKAMKEQSHQNWLMWIFENKSCPVCQDKAERENESDSQNTA